MGIKVEINQRYEGNMCGLMGNADGKPENDYQLPDKSITENIATFGNSWRKNPRCVNGIVPPDPCKQLTQAKQDAITEKCGKMKQTPFKQCNDRITPDVRYIPNCEYDLCAMKQNPSAAWCQALETYDQSCTSKGVNIDWEGKAEFKECGKKKPTCKRYSCSRLRLPSSLIYTLLFQQRSTQTCLHNLLAPAARPNLAKIPKTSLVLLIPNCTPYRMKTYTNFLQP